MTDVEAYILNELDRFGHFDFSQDSPMVRAMQDLKKQGLIKVIEVDSYHVALMTKKGRAVFAATKI